MSRVVLPVSFVFLTITDRVRRLGPGPGGADARRHAGLDGRVAHDGRLHPCARHRGGGDPRRPRSRRRAREWLESHTSMEGLPAGSQPFISEMRNAASAVASTDAVGNAAVATATMLATCGSATRPWARRRSCRRLRRRRPPRARRATCASTSTPWT